MAHLADNQDAYHNWGTPVDGWDMRTYTNPERTDDAPVASQIYTIGAT